MDKLVILRKTVSLGQTEIFRRNCWLWDRFGDFGTNLWDQNYRLWENFEVNFKLYGIFVEIPCIFLLNSSFSDAVIISTNRWKRGRKSVWMKYRVNRTEWLFLLSVQYHFWLAFSGDRGYWYDPWNCLGWNVWESGHKLVPSVHFEQNCSKIQEQRNTECC